MVYCSQCGTKSTETNIFCENCGSALIKSEYFNIKSCTSFNQLFTNENKRILKFITDFFCDIDFKKINIYKIRNLKLTKNQTAFQKPFDLAKMFLENSSIDMNQHKIKTISLLWDMNKLFEEFVFEFIRRNKDKINEILKNNKIERIKYQKGKRLLYCVK